MPSKLLTSTLILTLTLTAAAHARKLLPTDEAPKNPSFLAFRQQLLTAVKEKDHRHVLSILAPDVSLGFSGDKGIPAFKKKWRPESPDSKLWPTLQSLLALGGSFQDGSFVAPYVYSKFPEDLDSIDHQVVIGQNVKVRAQPSLTAPVIDLLTYDIVETVFEELPEGATANPDWEKIKTPTGKTGFMSKQFLRRAIDYRASFTKIKGQWKLQYLVAGD